MKKLLTDKDFKIKQATMGGFDKNSFYLLYFTLQRMGLNDVIELEYKDGDAFIRVKELYID